MPAPLVGAAVAVAARLAAKKAAQEAAKKAAKKAASKTTDKIASNSVKVVKQDPQVPNDVRIARNNNATKMAARMKSGELAKTTGSRVNTNPPLGKTKTVVKINSAPAKSADAAKKAAKKAASKTTDKIAENSVKTVPARGEAVNTTMNRLSDVIVKNMKSGRLAKEMSKDVNSITKGTIKINSAPAKSANAAKKAADAKALKAANKKKK